MSPRASKKRRTESGADDTHVASEPPTAADEIPGNQIEQELASALGAGYVDAVERPDDGSVKVENSVENPPSQTNNSTMDPDMAAVISNIMDHAERVETQVSMGQQQISENTENPPKLMFVKANSHLKIQSLPILDNLVGLPLEILCGCVNAHIFLVYPDLVAFGQVELPGHHRACIGARVGEWTGLCNHALAV